MTEKTRNERRTEKKEIIKNDYLKNKDMLKNENWKMKEILKNGD
jgi:hypothetical protein